MTEPKRMGFRSRNPNAMTAAERQQKWRRSRGLRQLQVDLTTDTAAAVIYIRNQWGMSSNREAALAAIRFLALCTRQGLTRLPQTIDD
jgi:hypothetical protein